MLFRKKMDGGLRLCVDYRALNKAMVKNLYPLPFSSEMLDRVQESRIFMKLDLHGGYNLILIKEGDEYKTAFRTRYGQFEYRVMPFGRTNPPATFQSYINNCLRPYTDDFAICYVVNIPIYSTNNQDHEEHVCQVLDRLKEFSFYCKAKKCQFGVSEVALVGFSITPDGIGMESDRICRIEVCPTIK